MDEDITLINKVLSNTEYYAEEKISEGSYGQIFRVVHIQKKNVYALKALQLSKLQKFNKMHEATIELLILTKLSHPGVIKIYNAIQKDNYIGLVLQLCPYGDLYTLMKNVNKKMQLAQKKRKIMVYYLAQILEVIDYLHSNQIIHRDIKPQNIVIGPDLKIRFIDFGTAKILSNNMFTPKELAEINASKGDEGDSSPRKSFVGSANYLSPQGLKLKYSEKNDIWAFGVIAYKFYYNHLPFQGIDNIQIFKKISENEIMLSGKVDPGIQQLLVISLKKDPDQRATAKMLKLCTIFKDINFKNIFTTEPPIFKEQLMNLKDEENGQFLFEVPLEKKMFFGNFKLRLLTISNINGRLFMSYRYLPSKKIKREFELSLNDYAQTSKEEQFEVITSEKKYCFRVKKGQEPVQIVNKINGIIKKGYQLE